MFTNENDEISNILYKKVNLPGYIYVNDATDLFVQIVEMLSGKYKFNLNKYSKNILIF